MAFDLCDHKITQLVIRAGILIRSIKGLPREENITILYEETAPLLGIIPRRMNSADTNQLPSPAETKDEKGRFIIPRQDCPVCGVRESMILISLCPTCEASEGGKYHSAWKCMNKECTGIEKSEKFLTQRLTEMGIQFGMASKKEIGVQTLTNNGLK
jgi:hypothetical protein